jgi:hypothetical protein
MEMTAKIGAMVHVYSSRTGLKGMFNAFYAVDTAKVSFVM